MFLIKSKWDPDVNIKQENQNTFYLFTLKLYKNEKVHSQGQKSLKMGHRASGGVVSKQGCPQEQSKQTEGDCTSMILIVYI